MTSQSNSTAPLFPASTSVLSVTPTSFTSFSHVALALSPPSPFSPTIISLDPSLSARLPFPLKRGPINSLLRAGLCFELVLRGMVRQDDPGQPGGAALRRRNWISGAREVVRATGGKGIIISSGAVSAEEMRASQDIVNLWVCCRRRLGRDGTVVLTCSARTARSCSLIGLTASQAKDALTVNPQRALLRGRESRSSTYSIKFADC